jgi:hypothetical protein
MIFISPFFIVPRLIFRELTLCFLYYNFCRVHQTLRVTPAMEAGITDHVWSLEDIINFLN